jgi:hypothetical protein
LQNMRYFAIVFRDSTNNYYFCRRISGIRNETLSYEERIRYVYTRKRKLDRLPLGRFTGIAPSGESVPLFQ